MKTREKIYILKNELGYKLSQIEKMSGIGKGYLYRVMKRQTPLKQKTRDKINNLFQFISNKVNEVLNDKNIDS